MQRRASARPLLAPDQTKNGPWPTGRVRGRARDHEDRFLREARLIERVGVLSSLRTRARIVRAAHGDVPPGTGLFDLDQTSMAAGGLAVVLADVQKAIPGGLSSRTSVIIRAVPSELQGREQTRLSVAAGSGAGDREEVMAIEILESVRKIFGGSEPTEAERAQLFQEVMLMVLARATAADSNISGVEVETVQEIVEQRIGVELSSAEVRVAANSDIFESTPLSRFVASARDKLTEDERSSVMGALSEVIRVDDRIGSREVAFYDQIADALQMPRAGDSGLMAD